MTGPVAAIQVRERAERAAASLPALLVAARRVAATVLQGVHGRRQSGPGETFWQFRRYQPGDAAAMIDWRQSAKSVPLYVREQEWEASASVWLWRDSSPSMAYRSKGVDQTKDERATLLLLALAALLLRGGEQVALLGHGARPLRGAASLERLAETLWHAPMGAAGLPGRDYLPRHAQVVMIGDFLDPVEDLHRAVNWLTGTGATGHLLQVLDPAEEELPFSGRVRFDGPEGEGSMLIGRVETVREAYRTRLAAQRAALAALARTSGWTFLVHRTDRPPETALLALYLALSGDLGRKR